MKIGFIGLGVMGSFMRAPFLQERRNLLILG